jgi:UPF0716 protein FxsA
MRDSLACPEGTDVKALIFLLAYPLAEIAGFVLVGDWIGVLPTLGLVILSGLVGTLVLRRHAMVAGQDLRGSLQGIRGPVGSLADGALVVLGAMLLIVPGFLGDLVAIPLLIPPLRRALVAGLSGRFAARRDASGRGAAADVTIIDGTFYEVDPDEPPKVPRDGASGWTRH